MIRRRPAPEPLDRRLADWYEMGQVDSEIAHEAVRLRRAWRRDPDAERQWCERHNVPYRATGGR